MVACALVSMKRTSQVMVRDIPNFIVSPTGINDTPAHNLRELDELDSAVGNRFMGNTSGSPVSASVRVARGPFEGANLAEMTC